MNSTSTPLEDLVLHPENSTQGSPTDSDLSDEVHLKKEENLTEAPGVTKVIQKPFLKRRKYRNITDAMRKKLIEAVEDQGEKIKHAAKRFNINYSSAKSICQVFKREGRASKKAFKTRVHNHFKEDSKPAETNSMNVKLSPEYTMKDASLQTKASPGSEQEVLLKPSQIESVKPMFNHHDSLSKINQINNLINQATGYSGNKIQQIMMPSGAVMMNNNQISPQNMIYTGILNNHHQMPQGFNMANMTNMGPSVNSTENILQNLIGLNNNFGIDNSRFRVIPVSNLQGNMNMNPVFMNMNMPNMPQQPVKYAIIQPSPAQQQQMIRFSPQINQINNINANLYQSTLNYF